MVPIAVDFALSLIQVTLIMIAAVLAGAVLVTIVHHLSTILSSTRADAITLIVTTRRRTLYLWQGLVCWMHCSRYSHYRYGLSSTAGGLLSLFCLLVDARGSGLSLYRHEDSTIQQNITVQRYIRGDSVDQFTGLISDTWIARAEVYPFRRVRFNSAC